MRIGYMESSGAKTAVESSKSDKKASPKVKRISADEIRAKVAANNSQLPEKVKLGDKMGFSRYEKETDTAMATEKKNLERPSDVGLNDPNDPSTRGKLKNLLSNGAVNFKENERKILEKILDQD